MNLSFDQLRRANIERQKIWCPDQQPDLSFLGNELAGEIGEACNVIKKLERERHGWRGSRDTVAHLVEELADGVICLDRIASKVGVDLGKAVVRKFNATSEVNGLATRLDDGLPFKLNQWIDDEVQRCAEKYLQFDEDSVFITTDDAAEIARGAAVHVMTDIKTLIGNLRAAGYTVLSPDEQSEILKALVEHNDMLRSAHSVATRRGQQTNWSAFTSRVLEVLTTGHQASNLAREATKPQIKGEPVPFTA